jgi:hypothetical protein
MLSRMAAAHGRFMAVEEFVVEGYMQEVNRCFLHVMGLALVAEVTRAGYELRVVDCRTEPGGIVFPPDEPELSDRRRAAATTLVQLWSIRAVPRTAIHGFVVQPPESL